MVGERLYSRVALSDETGVSFIDRIGGQLQKSDDNGATFTPLGGLAEYYQNLAAPNQQLTVGGGTAANPYLNGDLDGDYMIDSDIFVAATGTVSLLMNGSSTNMSCGTSDGTVGAQIRTDWTFSRAGAPTSGLVWNSGDVIYMHGVLHARSGHVRHIEVDSFVIKSASKTFFKMSGIYDDITTNVTSFGVLSSVAAGIGAGSYIRVARMQTTNALSLTPGVPQVVYASLVDNVISP